MDMNIALIIPIIAPFLSKGGEAIAEGVGKDLWELIKKPFKSEKDQKVLEDFKNNPEDKKMQMKMEVKLEDFFEENPDIFKEIEKLLPEARKQMPKINMQQNIYGRGATGIQGSVINIHKN